MFRQWVQKLDRHLREAHLREADAEVDAAWRHEIARRMHELDSGAVQAVPWEEAEAMIFGDEDAGADQDRFAS